MTVRMHGREFTMKRKALALLLAAVMTTAMLAGCGKTQTGGSDGASQGTTPAGTESRAYHVGKLERRPGGTAGKAAGGL